MGYLGTNFDIDLILLCDNNAREGNRENIGNPRQHWEKDITYIFDTIATKSRVAEDRNRFREDIWTATS